MDIEGDPRRAELDKLEETDPDYIAYWRLKALIEAIPPGPQKSYIAMHYGTGARLREILGDKNENRPGVKWRDIELNSKGSLIITLYTLKNRKQKTRMVPIPASEKWIINAILDPYEGLPHVYDAELYGWTGRSGENYAHRWLDHMGKSVRTHALRHSRSAHLRQKYGYNTTDLRFYLGHTDERPTAVYQHYGVDDLLTKMEARE